MADSFVIIKGTGASGAAPAWTGVTAFTVTEPADRRILPVQAEAGEDHD